MNSHVISIHSLEELSLLGGLLNFMNPNSDVWADPLYVYVGLKYQSSAHAWSDGTPNDFDGWLSGQPNSGHTGCAITLKGHADDDLPGSYGHTGCETTHTFACQVPDVPRLTRDEMTLAKDGNGNVLSLTWQAAEQWCQDNLGVKFIHSLFFSLSNLILIKIEHLNSCTIAVVVYYICI